MKKSLLCLFTVLCTLSVFISCSEDDLSADAKIEAFTFDNPLVTVQPVIDGTTIQFVVSDKMTKEELAALVPTITISANASMTPATGVAQDFSKPVLYKVTSQDGATTTEYTVTSTTSTLYTFEEWVAGVEGQKPEDTFYEVANGWSSSNTGAHFLKAFFQLTDRYPVTQSAEAHSGKSAARLETLDTKGMDMGFVKVPKVTSGSLFLGKFVTDMTNTLNSTKFGNEYHAKPISLKGYYKYTPGKTFYRCESAATCDVTTVDAKTVDQCAINAVLYEVNSYDDEDYLTGVNINDTEKLTAIARLEDGSAKNEWTAFELEFKYLKTYDASRKYRFAIICSSSNDGNNFNGAPGSILYVDDFEVITE